MIIWLLVAVCTFLYGVVVWHANSGTLFYLIWFLAAGCAAGAAWLSGMGVWKSLPLFIRLMSMTILVAGLIGFLCVELCVVNCFRQAVPEDLEVLVVLGAQVRESGPTRTLKYRLDEAYTYLSAHPETRCIVSGGKGSNEPDSEARIMGAYLVGRGIDKNRIILEDRSVNTRENLLNSQAFLNKEQERVGIVTSDFHLFRSLYLAKKMGYQKSFGIPAKSSGLFFVNNMVREFFAICQLLILSSDAK